MSFSRLLRSRRAAPAERPAPRIPEGLRVYAIGDIHGRLDCLRALEAAIAADAAARPAARNLLVTLGDYVDRGPDSAGVLEHLLAPPPASFERRLLRGNHEAMFQMVLEDPAALGLWRPNGGLATLASYRVAVGGSPAETVSRLRAAVPPGHLRLLERLEILLRIGDYAFVHAGIRPGVPLEQQDEQDLLWIREEFLDHPGPHAAVVVHGHTPVEAPEDLAWRINLDTGAFATGRLTCAVLEGAERRFLQTATIPA